MDLIVLQTDNEIVRVLSTEAVEHGYRRFPEWAILLEMDKQDLF